MEICRDQIMQYIYLLANCQQFVDMNVEVALTVVSVPQIPDRYMERDYEAGNREALLVLSHQLQEDNQKRIVHR